MPKILLVEDETMISDPLGIVLRSAGYGVDIAGNGLEALRYCQDAAYDVILLDVMMPVCNGVEFLRRVNLPATAPRTKVILLTNLTTGAEVDAADALGISQRILKATITPRGLLDLVRGELDT